MSLIATVARVRHATSCSSVHARRLQLCLRQRR